MKEEEREAFIIRMQFNSCDKSCAVVFLEGVAEEMRREFVDFDLSHGVGWLVARQMF